MIQIYCDLVFEEPVEIPFSIVEQLLKEYFPHSDVIIKSSAFDNHFLINIKMYVIELSWEKLLTALRLIRGHIQESGIELHNIILGSNQRLYTHYNRFFEDNGIWIDGLLVQEFDSQALLEFLKGNNAIQIDHWYFISFEQSDEDTDDEGIENVAPDEHIRVFGKRVNGSNTQSGVPVSLKIRTMEGYTLTDYISKTYQDALHPENRIGGLNVILTTVLQMNNKVNLINHYSERANSSEDLFLFSLPSLNLEVIDERDKTHIANLASSGDLIIKDIILGE